MSGGYTAYPRLDARPEHRLRPRLHERVRRAGTCQPGWRPRATATMPLWYGQPYRRTHACTICGAAVARDDAQHEPPLDHPARHAGPVHRPPAVAAEPARRAGRSTAGDHRGPAARGRSRRCSARPPPAATSSPNSTHTTAGSGAAAPPAGRWGFRAGPRTRRRSSRACATSCACPTTPLPRRAASPPEQPALASGSLVHTCTAVRRPGAWVRGPARNTRRSAVTVQAASALSRWWAGRAATDPRGAGLEVAEDACGGRSGPSRRGCRAHLRRPRPDRHRDIPRLGGVLASASVIGDPVRGHALVRATRHRGGLPREAGRAAP